ncbi:MAG: type II methionyl aminopeptidase [Candidatus Aenigmarchaeota archaeon CG_4_10_14_0_8_um_filter_37_24]|nr:MAG: type II methionyl aminopeptidase [Candidatus Aenigmarchaeota archaeon CG01_land_8_20_14_3_00_37_9]PIW41461.1 MAG: type II methionyl aminopeptidase [Candidatus Aenigmarchaeota archaeon CG15_BIG_FIL_POST_REV_8_21_14_020_37_27]PIX51150.1 MAG: type II methionyl aminopeptidase [Candidatus Aenigmarchaeota archaeon CG_4_8_14_3_um_filter_37_24]PIY36150.1 MAG: type II methionyl aminopeptidase [Candidatus Aenigmarchaeota archaeon CG_4_10_14_3_um_filter_37_21]PIZ35723.1 MAG: type II methionyl amin
MSGYMEKEILESYKKAGVIHKEAREFAVKEVKEGVKVLDLAERIEKMIKDKGGGIAFPVNISINDIAAHYTPDADDTLTFKQGDLVKVDIGVHVDGYIADAATTVSIGGQDQELIKAAEDAVDQFIKEIRPGKTVGEMSKLVEDIVLSHGFNPIRNLAGHSMEQYLEHGLLSIPNGKIPSDIKIPEDTALGMEVFTTTGEGWVKESSPALIYVFSQSRPVRLRESRKIAEKISQEYKTLPFAKRWLKDVTTPLRLHLALKELENNGVIRSYPPLREKSHAKIAQHEETIIVQDKPIVTTR